MNKKRYRSTLRWNPSFAQPSFKPLRQNPLNAVSTLPLLKITVPYFLRPDPTSLQPLKTDILDEKMESLGTLSPKCIASMLKDQKLMQKISLSREIRKNAERKRLRKTHDVAELLEQADKAADAHLSEEDKAILQEPIKAKPKGHMLLTMTKKLITSCRQIVAKSKYGAATQKTEIDSVAKKEKEKARIILEKLAKENPSNKPKLTRSATRSSIQSKGHNSKKPKFSRSPTLSSIHGHSSNNYKSTKEILSVGFYRAIQKHLQKNKTQNYKVDGYEQLCTAADNLCEAFKKGVGQKELSKYQEKFKENTIKNQLENHKTNLRRHLTDYSIQTTLMTNKVNQLDKTIKEKVTSISKWLDNY